MDYIFTGDKVCDSFRLAGLSSAVVLPKNANYISVTGHGGINLDSGTLITSSAEEQIEASFMAIEKALLKAGAKIGLASVYKFTTFIVDMKYEAPMMKIWKRIQPNHFPSWVCVGVATLFDKDAIIEIQADAICEVF
ncbi:uncharacterized protein PRCAT00001434001 [Priceomyces carsonii]|uniref:uncharacterized protein n=1 Tax=Priceomyces carsonii TaxID=28549 RepID=UPI002ED8C2DA|nr:unnamed protein product [Priceomyces carsonii]